MDTLPIVLLGTGFVLIYSAVKKLDPRDVVKAALRGESLSSGDGELTNPKATRKALRELTLQDSKKSQEKRLREQQPKPSSSNPWTDFYDDRLAP